MPCYDDPRQYSPGWNEAQREFAKERARLVERCDTNARVACEALRLIEWTDSEKIMDMSAETQRWWKAHKEFDNKRKK